MEFPPNFQYNPSPTIPEGNPQVDAWLRNGVDEETYNSAVAQVTEDCSGGVSMNCRLSSQRLSLILFLKDGEIIADEEIPEVRTSNNEESLQEIPDPEITPSAIGALLIPYLLIKWGSTILHNTFPRRVSNYPIITGNVSALSVTLTASGSDGDSSSQSGEGGDVNSASLTLNGHLRNEHGEAIKIDIDGAPLVVSWGYPNTSAVRRITLIPKSINDSYFNEETTTIEFKGVETAISRFAAQRIYSEGNWANKVEDTFNDYCRDLGFSDEECVINMPEDYDPTGTTIPEQVQTGDNLSHLHYLVESIGGCRLVFSADGENAIDGIEATVDCEGALDVRDDTLDDDFSFKLVENAMWLGPELLETVTISGQLQDTSSNTGTSGPGCSGDPSRPRNETLTQFSTCGYEIDAKEGYQDKKRDNHWQVAINLEGEVEPGIPLPFKAQVIDVLATCPSGPELDESCNEGLGNLVRVKSLEENTSGEIWTFYHLKEALVSASQTINANEIFAVVGRSGSIDKPRLSFYTTKDDEVILNQTASQEYLNTLVSSCRSVESAEGYITGGYTSETVCPAGAQHIHVQYTKAPKFSEEVTNMLQQVFDNTVEGFPDLCLDLNCAPSQSCNECYKKGDRNKVLSCIDAHSHSSNWGWACDFWIGESRIVGNTENLPVPNPFPSIGYNTLIADYGGGSCGMGYTVLWENGVEYFHLDPWLGEGSEGDYGPGKSTDFPVLEGLNAVEDVEEEPEPPISVDEPTAIQSEWLNMPDCQYSALSDERAAILNRVAKELGYNPQMLAQMLQIESTFDPSAINEDSGAYGLFQCIEAGDGKCDDIFACGNANTDETFECQLRALPRYYEVLGCPAKEKPEYLYRCISTPACIGMPEDTPLSTWYSASTINGNAWFDENGNATCRAISWAARDYGCLDPRIDNDEFIPSTSSSSSPCRATSSTQTLNAAAIDGTGLTGIANVKYGQSVELSAEFGIRPRNIYLAPVSPGGTPQYVLLSDAINSKGFIDWKIKTVTFNWQGTWRIQLVATRSGEDAPELPRVIKPPRNLNEWIRYYWYPDPEREARELTRDAAPEFDETGALTNAYDDEKAGQDRFASSEVGLAWEELQSGLLNYEEEASEENQAALEQAVNNFHSKCEQAAYSGCLDVVEEYDSSGLDELIDGVPLSSYFRTRVYIPTKEKSETFGVED